MCGICRVTSSRRIRWGVVPANFISLRNFEIDKKFFFCNNPITFKGSLSSPNVLWENTKRREKHKAVKILLIACKYILYLFVREFHPLAEGARYARNNLSLTLTIRYSHWIQTKEAGSLCVLRCHMISWYACCLMSIPYRSQVVPAN